MKNHQDYPYNNDKPLQVLIQKANQIDKQKQETKIQKKKKESYLNNTIELRKGLRDTFDLMENLNKKQKKSKGHRKQKKSAAQSALSKLRSQSHVNDNLNFQDSQRLYSPQPNKPKQKKFNDAVVSRLYQHKQKYGDEEHSMSQSLQHERSIDLEQLKTKPSISKKSEELVENKFKQFMATADQRSLSLIYHKHQFTQTIENSKETIINSFHSKNKKKDKKQVNKNVPQKMKKIHENSEDEKPKDEGKQTDQKTFAEKEIQTVESSLNKQETPLKSQKKSKTSSKSASFFSPQKGTNYIPIYERYEFILQEKRNHLAEIQKEIDEEQRKQGSQMKQPEEDAKMDTERVEEFVNAQYQWLSKKNHRIQTARLTNQQKKNENQMTEAEKGMTFNPVISEKSKEIVKQKFANKGFFERNELFEDQKKRRLEEQLLELESTHVPVISPRSRLLYNQSQQKKSKLMFQSSQWCEDSQQY